MTEERDPMNFGRFVSSVPPALLGTFTYRFVRDYCVHYSLWEALTEQQAKAAFAAVPDEEWNEDMEQICRGALAYALKERLLDSFVAAGKAGVRHWRPLLPDFDDLWRRLEWQLGRDFEHGGEEVHARLFDPLRSPGPFDAGAK